MCSMLFNAVISTKKNTRLIYNGPTGEIVEYDFPIKSKFDIKETNGGFVFTKNSKVITPVIIEADMVGNSFSCTTENNTYIDLDCELGYITPEYHLQNRDLIVATDGKIYTVSPTKSTTFSGYTVALDKQNKPISAVRR